MPPPDKDLALCDFIAPLDLQGEGGEGSTDVGDTSWAVPTVQARVATCAVGTPFHTWQTAIEDKALRDAAWVEHRAQLDKTPYVSPLPADVEPPIVTRQT